MVVFNIHFKHVLGPSSFESVVADTEEDARSKFIKMYPDRIITDVFRPRMGARW